MDTKALEGVRVLDLSRILAGPTCTQLLGDLGAEVIKVERPGAGDDTRRWGPPYLRGKDGPLEESAYYLAANRNKRSVAIDFSQARGAELIVRLARDSDVLVENYKVGGLAQYGLDYATLRESAPGLVYCSISGFGQTGPRRAQPGYDFLAQAMAGIMSITGGADGEPMKVGVGIADIVCGLYASTAILAALRHRDATGQGQHIDLGLFDSTLSWLANVATNFFVGGEDPKRYGNGHPNIVPYQTFPTADGWVVIACGNDSQFSRLCDGLGHRELAADERFSSNSARVAHREVLVERISTITRTESTEHWVAVLERAGVPGGPVHDVPAAFADPQAEARGMRVRMAHPEAGQVDLVGNPIRLSETPVSYERVPPKRGEHTDEVLATLGLSVEARDALRSEHVIE